ncbi:substrate-binding and VWA domain-containing protein [Mycobacterium sp. SMC-2]|uniref:substrate-binding and VWA domain-containing protein n=1 Tax=Mycobacterium sp. SMC-2 TaxID=2857058 RepID=UPI0021B4237D|nr:substrate-binding and VWA domain-containing protein [Mycobacterium sp. SMC-2]UXA04607.1 substrate-binding and VWA domain-containing protein [Mycobacterium sp. SMC-2]
MGRHSLPDPGDSVDEPYGRGEPDAGPEGSDEAHYPADEEPYATDHAFEGGTADEYPDFPPRQPGPSSSEPPAASPSLLGRGHRGLGDWRGGHRSEGGRRGVSIGVIVALVAVIVVVGTVILWSFFGDALSNRSHKAAGRCVGGTETVAVIADPSIADSVQQFAQSYNSTAGPIGDHCVQASVKPADSEAVLNGFIGKWPAELGPQPALWVPGSSVSAARLAGATAQKTITDSRSLVTSPVVLAVRPELQQALANQNWAALPGLQTNPNGLAGVNLPAWGSLRLALPMTGNADAAFLAGEAVAAASVPPGAPATQGTGAVRTLLSAQPKLADNSLTEAMNTLLKPGDAAAAPVHAVITTEQQLFQRGQSVPNAKGALASWLPSGPVPVADYPTVLLSGSWLTKDQTSAASEFARFMHKPEQLAKLAKAGFRVNGVTPPSSPVTTFPALPAALSVGDDAMRATLAEAMATPSSGLAATIMLDQSMPGQEGGKSRLANVIAALQDKIRALPPTSVVGLWTFDGREGRSEVRGGPLGDPVNGQPRSAALTAALDKQYSSAGGAVSFTTLRLVYQDLQANYHAGQTNSILVITAGPHTDQTLDGPGLQEFIRKSADPAKPIAVNVIDFAGDPDRPTWEAVAQLSGGGYQNLATSASPDLAAAISAFLS